MTKKTTGILTDVEKLKATKKMMMDIYLESEEEDKVDMTGALLYIEHLIRETGDNHWD